MPPKLDPAAPPLAVYPSAAVRGRVGQLVDGRWRIEALVALGGSSAIYAATHRNGLRVAMKVLDGELSDNPTAVSHFLREGVAVNAIQHPGIVNVLDEGTLPDGAPFLVMPLLVGETAQQRLAASPGGLPAAEALAITDAVLDVLAAAHACGIVHRDLKPDNVFIESRGTVRLLDFGIARLASHLDFSRERTQNGTVVGTAGYLPPEQARGRVREAGPRSDLWSVGAMLYTLLTGRTLHEAPSLIASIVRAQSEAVAPARALVPGIGAALARVLDGALAFRAEDRWADAGSMRRAVHAAQHERLEADTRETLPAPAPAVTSPAPTPVPSDAPVAMPAAASRAYRSSAAPVPREPDASRPAPRPARARRPLLGIAAAGLALGIVAASAGVTASRPAAGRLANRGGSVTPETPAAGATSDEGAASPTPLPTGSAPLPAPSSPPALPAPSSPSPLALPAPSSSSPPAPPALPAPSSSSPPAPRFVEAPAAYRAPPASASLPAPSTRPPWSLPSPARAPSSASAAASSASGVAAGPAPEIAHDADF